MIELTGKYNTAKIFTDIVDQESIAQVLLLCNQEFVSENRLRLMPDIHAGAGCTIGTTMTIKDKIVPNLVGVDIGCGMHVVKLKEKIVDYEKLDESIHKNIPSGFEIRKTVHKLSERINLEELKCLKSVNMPRALLSIGTLGGGNHFIEVDKDEDNNLYLVIHSGSRHLGIEVANHYQNLGYEKLNKSDDSSVRDLIDNLKKQGLQKQISKEIEKLKRTKTTSIPKELAYVEGVDFDNYIQDMKLVQTFAMLNREAMAEVILDSMNLHTDYCFTTIHNYIDTENMILRKGAVSAQRDEMLLIPINMRDGSLLCIGKGNSDWNYSAPHGAGRLMSRSSAKKTFTVEEFEKSMNGIYTTSVNASTLDECPMTYKSIDSIINNIQDTVEIQKRLYPVYNFKAAD